tara:strand:- start:6 stop:194 length:189 start_codon:yes stop_codon:yes gene_type:complete
MTDDPMLVGTEPAQFEYESVVMDKVRDFIEQDRNTRSGSRIGDSSPPILLGGTGFGNGPKAA